MNHFERQGTSHVPRNRVARKRPYQPPAHARTTIAESTKGKNNFGTESGHHGRGPS